jgi:hypothetical protein
MVFGFWFLVLSLGFRVEGLEGLEFRGCEVKRLGG